MKEGWPEFMRNKLIHPEELEAFARALRDQEIQIATLNGSFDLLHAGHLHIIFEASKQADCLLVALNTDASIKRYKGEARPIVSLPYRLQMMGALSFVDYVTYFEEDDPRAILEIIQPNVHVNGAEWGENCVESEVVKKHGGKIHIVSIQSGLSTSKIVENIAATYV